MPRIYKQIPDNFESYEEAAEFWDTHDSTDYMDSLEEVEIDIKNKPLLKETDSDDKA
ncbi:MAG TPA: hypothetical protein C5S51_09445 [Methanosarcinaceae archaeon]|nr:hypothetical protein [Methanosarcinaceae archaeon]